MIDNDDLARLLDDGCPNDGTVPCSHCAGSGTRTVACDEWWGRGGKIVACDVCGGAGRVSLADPLESQFAPPPVSSPSRRNRTIAGVLP